MRILADESVDGDIVDVLRDSGHDVLYVAELEPGIPDEQVLSRSRAEDRLLLTADKDFGELVFRRKLGSSGVMLIRLAGMSPHAKALHVASTLSRFHRELSGTFSVLSSQTLRIRPAEPQAPSA